MKQRNDTGYPVTIVSDPPLEVGPGEVVEYPEVLGGFSVDETPAPKSKKPAQTTTTPEETA